VHRRPRKKTTIERIYREVNGWKMPPSIKAYPATQAHPQAQGQSQGRLISIYAEHPNR
jgi:hypothetical protein